MHNACGGSPEAWHWPPWIWVLHHSACHPAGARLHTSWPQRRLMTAQYRSMAQHQVWAKPEKLQGWLRARLDRAWFCRHKASPMSLWQPLIILPAI